jgi:predicted  nucleic acid-binding Zn-ribbon protein
MTEAVAQRLSLPSYPGLDPLDRRVRQWGDLLQMQHEERGEFLKETKDELPHGQWLKFLEQTDQTPRQHQKLMKAADLNANFNSYSQVAEKVPNLEAKLSLYSKSKDIPDTIKEEAREQIMNSPEDKTYTAAEVQKLLEDLQFAKEMISDQNDTISELEKEVGKVFDADVARRHRIERIGNHLVMGLGSDILGDITRFHEEREFYHPETRRIILSHCQRLMNFFYEDMDLRPGVKPKEVPNWQDIGKEGTEIHIDQVKSQSHYNDSTK